MDRREFVKAGAVTLALLSGYESASAQNIKRKQFRVAARLNRYENAALQTTSGIELDFVKDGSREIRLESAAWRCSWKASRVADRPDALEHLVIGL